MVYLQFQAIGLTETDNVLLSDFCEFLNSYIFTKLNTKVNLRKIQLRLNYLLNEANWISWNSDKYNLTATELMQAIHNSLSYAEYNNNIWKLQIDINRLIPRSKTSIDRLIRFLCYGDYKIRATSMFIDIQKELTPTKINALYHLFLLQNGYADSDLKLIVN